jgi:hypothetical protein
VLQDWLLFHILYTRVCVYSVSISRRGTSQARVCPGNAIDVTYAASLVRSRYRSYDAFDSDPRAHKVVYLE